MHGINLKFSGNIFQYSKQGLNQNFTQKIYFVVFSRNQAINFTHFFYINPNGRHYGKCENCQKKFVLAFECLEGSISPKNQ